MEYTTEMIKNNLITNKNWQLRALVCIYNNQTQEEQNVNHTKYINGVGFNGPDSEILSNLAKFYIKNKYLTDKQLVIVKKKIPKYHKQIKKLIDIKQQ